MADKSTDPHPHSTRHPRAMDAIVERVRGLIRPRPSSQPPVSTLETVFGQLELGVLEALWRRDTACAVAELRSEFPGAAYTTLMTTLDRLYKKSVLERGQRGRAYLYRPRLGRAELEAQLAREAFDTLLLTDAPEHINPLLSTFVDAVSERDVELLDELERLVRRKRGETRNTAADPDGGS